MSDVEQGQEQGQALGGLLAVDLGLRMGLAYFDERGQLRWYRSQHVGKRAQLKGAIWDQLGKLPSLDHLIVEGDRALGQLWARAAAKRFEQVSVWCVGAEDWRQETFWAAQRRSGQAAKASALVLAHEVIRASPWAPNPTALRHDAAEAVLLGAWAVRRLGLSAQSAPEGERVDPLSAQAAREG